jgi:hypothetical protein
MELEPVSDAVRRVWGGYLEMPGLTLTAAQARRLWNLDEDHCQAILDTLVGLQLLRRTAKGSYVRRNEI